MLMSTHLFPATDRAFVELRPRLFSIAYRMLGMRADAEDVVQEAWLRWREADHATLQSETAWLVTVTTRLAIDRLRARQQERAGYTGNWLPEPLMELESEGHTPESAAEQASDVSVAILWVLERLAPEERAAFLLRQVFDEDYPDIAATLGKSEASCRQMVHRAAERVKLEQPRFEVPAESHRELLGKFMQAAAVADRDAMKRFLAPDVAIVADGGGKVNSFLKILHGAARIAGVYWSMEHAFPRRVQYRMATINGAPGLLRYVDGRIESAQSFDFVDGRIAAVYIVRNPDKLQNVPAAPV
jgi:RNA polymerase sigma-70 factor (ECF subfamily)